jgi:hypothetical protein
MVMDFLPHIAVDVVLFTLRHRDLQVRLVQHPGEDRWALPGGSVEAEESLDDAAHRYLEKTGAGAEYLQQLYTFGEPGRNPRSRVISVTYFALVAAEQLKEPGEGADWHSLYHLPPLVLDHAEIVEYALTRLRYKIEYSAAAFALLPDEFTLRELQEAYMIILNDQRLDKANFRKKIRDAQILESVSRYRETGGRPAKLYRFRKDAQLEVKARRFFP